MKKDLLDLLKNIEQKSEELQKVFGVDEYFDEVIDIIWGLVANEYKVSKENEQSDDFGDIMYNFGVGKLSKKQAQSRLNKLK